MGEFRAQELANAVWAFAKPEMREEALIKAASSRAREMLGDSSARRIW